MGIIMKDNDWRLRKKEDGLYLVTYNKEPQRKIITNDYSSRNIVSEKYEFDMPVDDVESFEDAKSIYKSEVEKNKNSSIINKLYSKLNQLYSKLWIPK